MKDNMKKIYLFLLAAAGILAVASCAREELIDKALTTDEPSEVSTLTFSFDGTKTALVDGKTTWEAGDKIRVYTSDGGFYRDVEVPAEAIGQSSFSAEVNIKDSVYYAVYPIEASKGIADNKITVTLPKNPDGRFASANICVAITRDSEFQMKNVTAVLKVNIQSNNVVEMLQIIARNPIVGDYAVGVEKDKEDKDSLTFTPSATAQSLTVAIGGVDGEYFIPVLPGTYAKDFSITALRGNGGYQNKKTTVDNEIKLNSIIDLGLIGDNLSMGLPGEGTQEKPFTISNFGEMLAFASSVTMGKSYKDEIVSLEADILDTPVTAPAGYWLSNDDQGYFAGTFLGNNHTVKVELDGENCKAQTYVALFGVVDEGATVKDLKVTGTATATGNYTSGIIAYVRGTADGTRAILDNLTNEVKVSSTGNRVGGVVGYANYATITKCVNNAAITGKDCVAGVVGKASNATMENCTNTGAVTSTGTDTRVQYCFNGSTTNYGTGEFSNITGSHSTGGICGYVDHGSLENCSNSGAIQGYVKIGGVVGGTYWSPVADCVNTGAVTATGQFNQNIASQTGYGFGSSTGGIVGWMYTNGAITNCENSGTVKGKGGLGGIVGFASCNSNKSSGVAIKDCKNTGEVISAGVVMGGGTKNHNPATGGIAGSVSAFGAQITNIISCQNTGNVTSDGCIAGGIVGRVNQTRHDGSAVNLVDKCVNTGDVTAPYWTGGICGMALSFYNGVIRIRNSYNTGTITGNRTDADSGEVAGGILGANHCWNSSNRTNWGQVYNCYNTGNVFYEVAAHTKPYCGGIVGRLVSAGHVENVYNSGKVGPKGDAVPVAAAANRLGAIIGSLETGNRNNFYYLDGVCAQIVGASSTNTTVTIASAFNTSYNLLTPVTIKDVEIETLLDALNAWSTSTDYYKWKTGANGPEFDIQ